MLPVFDGDRINLFFMRTCQPLFSAAVVAYVESHVADITEKNALCKPVPVPQLPIDWLRMWLASLTNGASWRQHPGLRAWLATCRLNNVAVLSKVVTPDDAPRMALLQQMGAKDARQRPSCRCCWLRCDERVAAAGNKGSCLIEFARPPVARGLPKQFKRWQTSGA